MKRALIVITALILASSPVTAETEWADRIDEITPANVSLTEVSESEKYITIKGTAKSNIDISALMRAIEKSGLGEPILEQIQKIDDASHFTLRIKPKT